MLLTVAGSSCSGKSTAGRGCAGLPNLAVHDFDEVGVPDDADLRWRQRSMEHWLRRVLEYQSAGVDVLLLGQSPLGEVLATPSAVHLDGVAAALFDVADAERLRRLEARDPGRWDDAAKAAFVSWAHWHRCHAADPRYRQEVITTGAWPEMAWHRWTSWTADDPRWTVTVLDTTGHPPAGSAADLREWIVSVRAHPDRARMRPTHR